jgi:hypothetical protein
VIRNQNNGKLIEKDYGRTRRYDSLGSPAGNIGKLLMLALLAGFPKKKSPTSFRGSAWNCRQVNTPNRRLPTLAELCQML